MDDSISFIMALSALCFICVIQIVMIGVIAIIFQIRGNAQSQWKDFASKYGLVHQSPGFLDRGHGTISGQFEGRNVFIRSYSTGGRAAVMWTEVIVPIKNLKGLTLAVGAKGFDETIYKVFGAQDVVIGIPDFDDKFMIESNPPELASIILKTNAELRTEINALSPYELKYKDKGASCRKIGFQLEEAVLLNMLRLARKFADAVEVVG